MPPQQVEMKPLAADLDVALPERLDDVVELTWTSSGPPECRQAWRYASQVVATSLPLLVADMLAVACGLIAAAVTVGELGAGLPTPALADDRTSFHRRVRKSVCALARPVLHDQCLGSQRTLASSTSFRLATTV